MRHWNPMVALIPCALLFACSSDDFKARRAHCPEGMELCYGQCVVVGDCPAVGGAGASGSAGESGAAGISGSAGASGGAGESGTAGVSGGAGTGTSADCMDTSSALGAFSGQYDGSFLPVIGGGKSYFLQTNWWGDFQGQRVSYDGLAFTVSNQLADVGTSGAPAGYPSMFIGSYAGHTTAGSYLPKRVASLQSVPTKLLTNLDTIDTANLNAAYDVWFTASPLPLPSTQYDPGAGGAFLMVWLYDPANRQPRGYNQVPAHAVSGVSGAWDVWIDHSDPPCISYVSTTPLSGLTFDLKDFIKDSVDNGYGITNDMYLSVIFAGFEIWSGAEGAQVESFCAAVQ